MIKVAAILLGVVALGAGIFGLGRLFSARDDASIATGARGPGQVEPDAGRRHAGAAERPTAEDPPTSGPHRPTAVRRDAARVSDDALLHALELGNVALVYSTSRPPAELLAIQDDVAGPFDAGVAAAGQSILLVRDPRVRGIQALAWRHRLRAQDAADPGLREFAEAWLGRGAPRSADSAG